MRKPCLHNCAVRAGMRLSQVLTDFRIAVLLFVFAQTVSTLYLAAWSIPPDFYQKYHGAAVMIALGKGFVDPVESRVPAIADFLQLKQKSLDLAALPESVPTQAATPFQENHRYAMHLIGWWWRFFGISWDALPPLEGLFFAWAILAAYAFLRSSMPRGFAAAGALALTLSPGYLFILPYFRDFNVAPFTLTVFALLAYLLKESRPLLRALLSSALLGVTIGFGLGFRQDLIVCLPACLLLLACFFPGPLRRTWWRRGAIVAVTTAAFLLPAYPIVFPANAQARDSFHHINQGLTRPFNENLGLGGTPYDLGYLYRDEYTHCIVSSYAMLQQGRTGRIRAYVSPEYDQASRQYFTRQFLRYFPGDFVARWFASTARILNYSAFALDSFYPLELQNDFLDGLFAWRWSLLGPLSGWGCVLALLALATLSLHRLRIALAAGFALLYFGGYASLQFMIRHYFFLEIFFWWALGLLLYLAGRALLAGTSKGTLHGAFRTLRQPRNCWSTPVKNLAVFGIVAILAIAAPLWVTRAAQYVQVGRLYREYASAPAEPLEAEREGTDSVLLKPKGFLDPGQYTPVEDAVQVQTGLLAVEVEPAEMPLPLLFLYEAERPENNFSHCILVPPRAVNQAPSRIYFPVYNSPKKYILGERHFIGVKVPETCAANVKGFFRVKDTAALPVLMNLTLPEDWKRAPRFLSWQSQLLPEAVRAWNARRSNVLENGDFESWPPDAAAPDGASAPAKASTIAREHRVMARGGGAVRQTWSYSDRDLDMFECFRVSTARFIPGQEYELFVRARNLRGGKFGISAWQVTETPGAPPSAVLLKPHLIEIMPQYGFHQYGARFQTIPTTAPSRLVLMTGAQDPVAPGAAVIWDDWRLAPVTTP